MENMEEQVINQLKFIGQKGVETDKSLINKVSFVNLN